MIYMLVCSTVLILSTIFLFLDDTQGGKNKTLYTALISFIIGKWSGFLVAQGAKSRSKAIREALQTFAPNSTNVSVNSQV